MVSAIVLVCLYADPNMCAVVKSEKFYPTEDICYSDRVNAEEQLTDLNQGVVSFYCHNWGEPA